MAAPTAVWAAALASAAQAQSVGEPAGSSPLLAAADWVQGTLLGNLATTAAVIAVAVVGFLMLTGRIEWRRGLTVIVGCFIIFGATAIVAGIRSVASGLR
jgi:type IV secretion system protein VirB2